MRAERFTSKDAECWDRLVEQAPMATFLHSRRFLSYHGDRLEDASLLMRDPRGVLRAVLPAAIDPAEPARVTSHPGATYGGLVHNGYLYAEGVREALAAAASHYAGRGLSVLRYKPVPHIYHRSPSMDDIWALADLGAARVGCSLSVAIDLAARREPSTRRKRSKRKAESAGVEVQTEVAAEFWPVLEAALQRRYRARPIHSLAEIELLQQLFPNAISLVTARFDARVVAGVVLFSTPRVAHVQYMAASDDGMRVRALDSVLEHCIELAREGGLRYFDFGTSMENRGDRLQAGLHRFKAEFGGGGVLHEYYELVLGGSAV